MDELEYADYEDDATTIFDCDNEDCAITGICVC
jgi:hypothetical protein